LEHAARLPENSQVDSQSFDANPQLRASDADRDRAASLINNALAEGRLTAEEHSERLDAIYAAKTHADIVPLLDDLPGRGEPDVAVAPAELARRTGRPSRIISILGGATRKGRWHPEPVIDVLTVLGGAELDFRDAVLPGPEVTIRAVSVLGGVEITVPPEMRVVDSGVAFLGGREITGDSDESAKADAPVLRIVGTCVLGGLEVRRRPRRGSKGKRLTGSGGEFAGELGDRFRARRELRDDIRNELRERRRELRRRLR
jgi:hypothetical protein